MTRRTVTAVCALSLLLLACARSPEHPQTPPAYASRCEGTHAFDLVANGERLERYEGKRVWLSAVERGHVSSEAAPHVVVLLEARIHDGRFALSCTKGLDQDYAYPTWAVVIDADDSGSCTPNDVQAAQQFYGWNANVEAGASADTVGPVSKAHTVVGDHDAFDFCALYFPPKQPPN